MSDDDQECDVYIFGDITSWPWLDSDVSSYRLAKQINNVKAKNIRVHINSYGGEASEGLAIYNSLKNHSADVTTICDGFACSAASVVFMAGSERVMNAASLLMIHNAWSYAAGNAEELRKLADDLEKISETSANAYREAGVSLSDEDLQTLLDEETWITPQEALCWGFATSVKKAENADKAAASARMSLYGLVIEGRKARAITELGGGGSQVRETDGPGGILPGVVAPAGGVKLVPGFDLSGDPAGSFAAFAIVPANSSVPVVSYGALVGGGAPAAGGGAPAGSGAGSPVGSRSETNGAAARNAAFVQAV
ncbi:MAG: Clp protease ClpP, partial [Defluviitaleaceae bacterium]|nr:Clp protease ClpP [Defluviitaleaceae bacterium]